MLIKKLGHCCLLIQIKGLTILTDPGNYSDSQNNTTGIDLILITHEHPDHLHVESLKEVLKNNPKAKVITNTGVGKKLDEQKISYSILESQQEAWQKEVHISAFDAKHEEIFRDMGQVQNTGYFIDNKLFYPGDAFADPGKPVEVLALPVAGPWCKVADAINYALSLKPKKAFPVHDAGLLPGRIGTSHNAPAKFLPENGIEFVSMQAGDEKEF